MEKISKSFITVALILFVCVVFLQIIIVHGRGLAGQLFRNINSPSAFVDEYVNQNLPYKKIFLDGYSELLKVEQRVEYSDRNGTIVKGLDGQLFATVEETSLDELSIEARNVIDLAQYCHQRSVPFYYIQAPWKTSSDRQNVPLGAKDYTDQNSDFFIKYLNEDGVNSIDLRPSYVGGNFHYMTDHHWKTETCFDAVQLIEKGLEREIPSLKNAEVSDISQYQFDTKHKIFLGSIGRRIGEPYAGLDDFTYIYPKFETNLHFQHIRDDTVEIDKVGTFRDIMFSDPSESDYYCSVLNNSYCEMRIENLKSNNNLKCLMISDSYGRPFAAYMSLYFKNFVNVDTQNGRFKKDIYQFIIQEKPDVVIMMFNSGIYGNKDVFNFHEKSN